MAQNGLIMLSIISALAYLFWGCRQPVSIAKSTIKTLSIAALACLAFLMDGPLFLVAALAFSALGDALLSRDGDGMFLAGMAAFFTAHLAYIPFFLSLGGGFETIISRGYWAVVIVIYAGLMYRMLWPGLGTFRLPVAGYSMVIALMGLAALSLPLAGATGLIMLGAASFILSDTILAIEKFRLTETHALRRVTPYGVWFFYWGGQALITYGALT